jgi:GntR family transcriptional regulator, transcriptional repressor for pyruvate dehydrogenase complex
LKKGQAGMNEIVRAEAQRPMRVARMADMVAAELRNRIVGGELDDGDALPTEAVLLKEFPVSRPSLREALRILETEGLLRIRRGKLGGCIVQRPTPDSAAYHLGLVLQSSQVPLTDLALARELLEPVCASLAAQREDREEVAAELEALVDESEQLMGSGAEFTANLLKFHEAVVSSSQNQTLEILVGTIEGLWRAQEQQWAHQATAEGAYPAEHEQRSAVDAHRQLAQRIGRGDEAGAMRASRKHLAASMTYVCGVTPSGLSAPAVTPSRGPIVDAGALRP